nr:hypothetical protein [Tanacetum cinerariifolium]
MDRENSPGRNLYSRRTSSKRPSPAFVKENIDVLRTVIKELNNRGQEKITSHKLFNEESSGAGLKNSKMGLSAKEVGRKKGISKSHRSVRSEARSRSKPKSVKSKPQSVRASRRKWSSNSRYDTVSDSGSEDVSVRREQRSRRSPKYLFSCGRARGVAYASMVQDVLPDPKCELAKKLNDKIPKTVDKMWERVRAFIRGRRLQTSTKPLDPLGGKRVLVRLAGQNTRMGPEIEVIEGEGRNMGTYAPYARREGFTPLTKTPKEILAMDNVNLPPPPLMVRTLEKRNMNNGLRKIGSSSERDQARRSEEKGLSQRKKEGYQHGEIPRVPEEALQEGKKVAYLVVVNYVRNTWGKYRLVRSIFSSSTGLFSFKFSSMDGLDAMLENGLWFIQNNPLILKKWHPNENLLKEDGSVIPVWVKLHGVPVMAFSEDGLSAIATKLGTPLMLDSYTSNMCMKSWEIGEEERNYEILCSSCKVFGHTHEECSKNTGAGEKKNVKKPSQASRGVSIGLKMAFKSQKEYRPITKKPNTSSSSIKNKGMETTIKVSNLNPFDVLNSVDNDVEFGTNKGTSNLGNNEATLSVPMGIMESDSEVEVVYDDIGNLMTPTSGNDQSDKGYGTNSLLKQWRDSYPDNNDYDPYDDDMYENHGLFEHLQSICDDLDIMVLGRKKK